LEYEAHFVSADFVELVFRHLADVDAVKEYLAVGGFVDAADYVEQCGFAGA
jgi:hypothetical protein